MKGGSCEEAGLALTLVERLPSGLTVSGAPALGGAWGFNLSGVLGSLESTWGCPSSLLHENTGPPPPE